MLPRLDGSDPMTFCFVGRQLPTDELALLLPLARIEPLAAFGAAIHPASIRNPVLLITPVIHIKGLSGPLIENEERRF
jgi:hypothetical protein